MADETTAQIVLPDQLISSVDLSRLIRELEAVDESLRQMALRKPGEPTQLARSSVTLEELARANNVQLTEETQRTQMIALLHGFKDHAPRIHMSLAAEPSAKFTQKIAVWLRKNVHPLVLLEVGLQPTLAAGCVIRTNNKLFDMSLRHHFADSRPILVQKISEIGQKAEEQAEKAAVEAATATVPPVPAAPVASAAPQAPAAAAQTPAPTAPQPPAASQAAPQAQAVPVTVTVTESSGEAQ